MASSGSSPCWHGVGEALMSACGRQKQNEVPVETGIPQEPDVAVQDISSSDLEPVSAIERTTSQLAKQVQVQAVLQNIENHKHQMHKLKESVSEASSPAEDADSTLQAITLVQDLRKRARNHGEDLLEDMLSLDKLSGLAPEDRANRKLAIAALESLLENADGIKADLALLEKNLEAKREALKQEVVDASLTIHEGNSATTSEALHECYCPEDEWVFVEGDSVPQEVSMETDESFDKASEAEISDTPIEEQESSELSTDASNSDSESSATHAHVQSVLLNVENRKHQITKLKEAVSESLVAAKDADSVQQAISLAQELRKRARNHGEDLLEDMLSLDKLSGLAAADRANRKVAIAALESLLEDIDGVKADLMRHQKDLEVKQEELKLNQKQAPAEQATPTDVPAPRRDFWESRELPVRFNSKELPSHYVVSAAAPNLDSSNVEELRLSDDGSVLTITGLQLPTPAEADEMTHQVASYLQQLPRKLKTPEGLSRLAADAYVKMGRGAFGRFSESFQLPSNVDVRRIQASCNQGHLSVNLPKRVHRAVPRHPGSGAHNMMWR